MKKVLHALQKVSLLLLLSTLPVRHSLDTNSQPLASMHAFLGCKSILASMMLVHLLPDTRTAATTSRIVVFINAKYVLHIIYMYA